ncbi:prolipoprotein diacylglyceryl transferase, partial [Bacillus vallismortis]|nr:prolipoprotein diacylglyceryl transferase [Bacillus vallismortis]
GVVVLLLLRKANLRRGEMFLIYIIGYSIGRYLIEGMRTDSLMLTEALRIAQVISIVFIVLAVAAIIFRSVKGYSKELYT